MIVHLGCASPTERFDDAAQVLGFSHYVVSGRDFDHVVYYRRGVPPGGNLHVYLAGDAHPGRALRWFPPDPTPGPELLELVALDSGPSLLLGRPCAHRRGRCAEAAAWTTHRYGPGVVASLEEALRAVRARHPHEGLVLIGHSGGGTLAMLLAERIPSVRGVVTLAGNLDTAAWAAYHGYPEPAGTLNPALRPPLAAPQLHLLAAKDRVVPPALVSRAIARQPGARTRSFPSFDHNCCWAGIWRGVVEELRSQR
ncbi:MAG: alpha/beta fold hydrolase [Myxococcales bacterium]|nr:alpha/beta fold hydrolase [Myxococcales bacterium]